MSMRWRRWRGWRFHIGRINTVMREDTKGSLSIIVDHATITGRDWNTFGRGQHKKTSDGMVKPGHVKGWLVKHGFVDRE